MTTIKQRRDTAANWTSVNPVLALGEVGWESDTRLSKLGDGVTAWDALPYITPDLSAYAELDSPAFTGNPTVPTAAVDDNDTTIANTNFVQGAVYGMQGWITGGPTAFTGEITSADTPAPGDDSTRIPNTAWVQDELAPVAASAQESEAKTAPMLAPARVLSMAAVTLSGVGATVDGVVVQAEDRVMTFGNGADNGLWVVKAGAWERAADLQSGADMPKGTTIWIQEGTAWGARAWTQLMSNPTFSTMIWQLPGYIQVMPTAWIPTAPSNGHTIYDTDRRCYATWTGTEWATSALHLGSTWYPNTAYAKGTPVMYGGRLYKAKADNTNMCPALSATNWELLGGGDEGQWVERDPYFAADILTDAWQLFWKFGTVTTTRTTTVGEYETGIAGLKSVIAAGGNQRIYNHDETIVRDGETVVMEIRAKLAADSSGARLEGHLLTNDIANAPTPLSTGVVTTGSAEGNQLLTTSWATYTFTFTVPNGTKPRAMLNFIMDAPSADATILVDRVRMFRPAARQPTAKLPTRQVFTASGTWTKPQGCVYVEVEVQGGGGSGGGSQASPAGQHSQGSGGGAGGYARKRYDAAALGSSEAVVVGAGAASGGAANPGAAGGTSSFGTTAAVKIDATGGGAGSVAAVQAGNYVIAGGSAGAPTTSIQDFNFGASTGGTSIGEVNYCVSGAGGDSYFGQGGHPVQALGGSVSTAGNPGRSPGAGGSGAVSAGGGAAAAGGAGQTGVVIVTEYYAAGSGVQPIENWVGQASASPAITSATPVDLAGCTVTVPVGSTGEKYLVTATADIAGVADGSNALGAVRLVVDGVPQLGDINGDASTLRTRQTLSSTWVVSGVTAGNKVFKLQASNATASGSVTIWANGTRITVTRLTGGSQVGPVICTSTSRPAAPVKGDQIYETDTGSEYIYDGSAWKKVGNSLDGVWQAYTPTLSGFTLQAGAVHRYMRVGKTVTVMGAGLYASGTAGTFQVPLPAGSTTIAPPGGIVRAAGTWTSSRSGVAIYTGVVALAPTTGLSYFLINASGTAMNNTNPATWVAGDPISWEYTYEEA